MNAPIKWLYKLCNARMCINDVCIIRCMNCDATYCERHLFSVSIISKPGENTRTDRPYDDIDTCMSCISCLPHCIECGRTMYNDQILCESCMTILIEMVWLVQMIVVLPKELREIIALRVLSR